MKFEIICSFNGFCGNKAVISQGNEARLVNYYADTTKKLKEKIHVLIVASCELDEYGDIWIRDIRNQE